MTLRMLKIIGLFDLLLVGQQVCKAVEFPNVPSHGTKASAMEIRVIRQGESISFVARNTTYTEALQLLATLAGKRVVLERIPKTPLIVEYRDTTPENAFVSLLMSPYLTYKVRDRTYHVTGAK
jgi:hypothetical protein